MWPVFFPSLTSSLPLSLSLSLPFSHSSFVSTSDIIPLFYHMALMELWTESRNNELAVFEFPFPSSSGFIRTCSLLDWQLNHLPEFRLQVPLTFSAYELSLGVHLPCSVYKFILQVQPLSSAKDILQPTAYDFSQ